MTDDTALRAIWPDPDALAAEYSSRNIESSQPLKNDDDGLRGFELKDLDGYVLFFGSPHSTSDAQRALERRRGASRLRA
jgi:hypothetical protein